MAMTEPPTSTCARSTSSPLEDLVAVLDLTDHMVEVCRRPVPKVPALRGRTVLSLFFEDSTRTRLSFETAAKRLSADTMTFSALVVQRQEGREPAGHRGDDRRHGRRCRRRPPPLGRGALADRPLDVGGHRQRRRRLARAPHPGAARRYTIRPSTSAVRRLDGAAHIAIVGDIKHSRVARSNVLAFTALGAEVTLVAPPTLLPPSLDGWPVRRSSHDLDDVLPKLDVVYLLRMQRERMTEALVPEPARVHAPATGSPPSGPRRLPDDALVMHPGPDEPRRRDRAPRSPTCRRSVIIDQVAQRRGRAHGGAVPAARLGRRALAPASDSDRQGGARWLTLVIKGGRVVDATGERGGRRASIGGRPHRRGRRRPRRADARSSTPAAASSPPAWSTSTRHLRQPGQRGGRDGRDRAPRPPRSAATPRSSPCPTPTPAIDSRGVVREVLELGPRRAVRRARSPGPSPSAGRGEQLAPHGRDGRARRAALHRRRHAACRTPG